MKRLSTLLTALAFLCYGIALAQPALLDLSFDPGTGADEWVYSTILQPDGKVIISGEFTSYNGTGRNYVARLNADGSLDTSFDPGTGANNWVNKIILQQDGKVIIVGDFTSYNGTGRNSIARLNADGSLDATFDPGTGASSNVYVAALQPDGKIIIGGNFTSYNGTNRNHIARLNTDGSLDTSFDPGLGASAWFNAIAKQPDGKFIIGGGFIAYNGTSRNRIARLNADGSLDATFNPGTGANDWVVASALQPDGKLIIVGDFTSYNGTARNRIARLNADGSLDVTFDPGTGADNYIHSITLLPNGKVIIGGLFTSYNGTGRNSIAQLNADGSIDISFDPGTGADDEIYTSVLQPDGKLIVGGKFTTYNGTGRTRIARLNGTPTGTAEINEKISLSIYPNPTTGKFAVQGAKSEILVYDLYGRKVLQSKETEIDMRGYAKGVYFVKIGETARKLVLH